MAEAIDLVVSRRDGDDGRWPLETAGFSRDEQWVVTAAATKTSDLCFLTTDTALCCRQFISNLALAPTDYSVATRAHFQSLRGDVTSDLLDEWIDAQLMADLTERVQALLWLPSTVLLLLLVARTEWWDPWPWSWGLIVVMTLNFALALSSVLILQISARAAKQAAEQSLDAKVKRRQSLAAASTAPRDAEQGEKLLDEIRGLRRGAFTGFWENPVLGALLVPSSGAILLEPVLP